MQYWSHPPKRTAQKCPWFLKPRQRVCAECWLRIIFRSVPTSYIDWMSGSVLSLALNGAQMEPSGHAIDGDTNEASAGERAFNLSPSHWVHLHWSARIDGPTGTQQSCHIPVLQPRWGSERARIRTAQLARPPLEVTCDAINDFKRCSVVELSLKTAANHREYTTRTLVLHVYPIGTVRFCATSHLFSNMNLLAPYKTTFAPFTRPLEFNTDNTPGEAIW